MKKLAILGALIFLVGGGAIYFITNYSDQMANDLGGDTPEQMFSSLAEVIRAGDVASAEKYFNSQDPEGRKVWANILLVNKTEGLLGALADSLAAPKFLKSITENYQQFLLYNKPQPQGVLVDIEYNEELSLWQIKALAIVNL